MEDDIVLPAVAPAIQFRQGAVSSLRGFQARVLRFDKARALGAMLLVRSGGVA